MQWRSLGIWSALVSAVLFGASTPLAKLLLRGVEPWMLAGVLYLGSGIGLAVFWVVTGASRRVDASGAVRGLGWVWLGFAIASGGVMAPVLLMIGLSHISASAAALLLNLEGVLTVALAWAVFREHIDGRIAAGMVAIVAGGVVLAGSGDRMTGDVFGPLAIAGACLAWAIDNNLTRNVSSTDPVYVAMLKGGIAGVVNVAIARWLGSPWPDLAMLSVAALLGFAGYGVSLVLFVMALRRIGVARTAAYFSLAPFFGAILSVIVFRESVTLSLLAAGLLMAIGVSLHLAEHHEHPHRHESSGEREGILHTHPHYPDVDHRHGH